MVKRLHRMIHRSHPRRYPEPRGRVPGVTRVVKDCPDAHARRHESRLDAVCVGVSPAGCALGRAERGRDREMDQVVTGHFVRAEGDGFGGVDGGSAADGDDGVDGGIACDEVGGSVNVGDGAVLLYVREGAGVMGSELGF